MKNRARRLPLLAWLVLKQLEKRLYQLVPLPAHLLCLPPPAVPTADKAHTGWSYPDLWFPPLLWLWRKLCELHHGYPTSTPCGHIRARAPVTSDYQALWAVVWLHACCFCPESGGAFCCCCAGSVWPNRYTEKYSTTINYCEVRHFSV